MDDVRDLKIPLSILCTPYRDAVQEPDFGGFWSAVTAQPLEIQKLLKLAFASTGWLDLLGILLFLVFLDSAHEHFSNLKFDRCLAESSKP